MEVSNELSSEGSNEVIPQVLANVIHQDLAADEFSEEEAADEFSGEDSSDDITSEEDLADDLIPHEESVIIVLITVENFLLEDDEENEEDPVRELSVESVKNYATTHDDLDPIPVKDNEEEKGIPVQDDLDSIPVKDKDEEKGEKVKDIEEEANSVKDPNLLGISEKNSKEEKEEEDNDDEAPANEDDDDDVDVDVDDVLNLEIALRNAVATAENNGTTVKILRYHGVNGVTQAMESLFNLNEVTFFVVEECFATTMLKYVKKSIEMIGIPCVIYSDNLSRRRYIWNDGNIGSSAHRARRPEVDLIDEFLNGHLARDFARMRRRLRKQALPSDAESVDKVQ